jgi:S-formylglutathione hydrolase FrmB
MDYGPGMRPMTRRALLLGAGGVAAVGTGAALVDQGIIPGRARAYDALGLNGDDMPIPKAEPGRRYDGSLVSERLGGSTHWSMSVPPGHPPEGLPLLVTLHGARATHRTAFDSLGIDRFLAQAVAAGVPPFAVASVDGGSTSYWHPRADGTDASAMVLDELVPLLRRRFGLGEGLGLYGWSMGGYGALRLALRGVEARVVVASSPALFTSYDASAPGAFDDRSDFEREGVIGEAADFPDLPLRVDCGKGDPFYAATRDFVDRLPDRPGGGFQAGGHSHGYWRQMLPAQLAFIGKQFA